MATSTGTQRKYDTIVKVLSNNKRKCGDKADPGISLTNYMKLPVEQYVCIKMPLDANLVRLEDSLFVLTVPPVNFFHLSVSPSVYCNVTQNDTAVIIESNKCILDGSPYVKGLNGCFKFFIRTVFRWEDSNEKVIFSSSDLFVEVDPPSPFSRIARPILERTGYIAMNTAISIIEREFVKSLSLDYLRWANDAKYREARAMNSCRVDDQDPVSATVDAHTFNESRFS